MMTARLTPDTNGASSPFQAIAKVQFARSSAGTPSAWRTPTSRIAITTVCSAGKRADAAAGPLTARMPCISRIPAAAATAPAPAMAIRCCALRANVCSVKTYPARWTEDGATRLAIRRATWRRSALGRRCGDTRGNGRRLLFERYRTSEARVVTADATRDTCAKSAEAASRREGVHHARGRPVRLEFATPDHECQA